MQPESSALLWDTKEAAAEACQIMKNMTLEQYYADRTTQLAIERLMTIIGEALTKLRAVDPDTAEVVPNLQEAISTRNIIVHAYRDVDNEIVWETVNSDLPSLVASVEALLLPTLEIPEP